MEAPGRNGIQVPCSKRHLKALGHRERQRSWFIYTLGATKELARERGFDKHPTVEKDYTRELRHYHLNGL